MEADERIGGGQRNTLVSVEFQDEIDLATGERTSRMFLKMYFDAYESGLLGALPAKLWQMLCAVSVHMDREGFCHPSHAGMAAKLGLKRETVSRRMKELLDFRFEGKPVITLERPSSKNPVTGTFSANRYRVLPISGLQFARPKEETHVTKKSPGKTKTQVTKTSPGNVPVTKKPGDENVTLTRTKNSTRTTQQNVCVDGKGEKELLAHFHQAFGRPEQGRFLKKEVVLAREVLANYGEEAALYLVDYVKQEAPNTNFSPRYFHAVEGYVDAAMGAFKKKQRGQVLAEKRRQLAEEEELSRQQAWLALSPEDRAREHFEAKMALAILKKEPLTESDKNKLLAELIELERSRGGGGSASP